MRTNDATYNELLSLRDQLDMRKGTLQEELDAVNRKLQAVSTTLELLDSNVSHENEAIHEDIDDNGMSEMPRGRGMDISSLHGLTQLAALKKIAEHSDGVLTTTKAKQIMLLAGLIKNNKNANTVIYNVIQRSDQFRRMGPGVYHLAGSKPDRPSIFGGTS
jgi:hypothetical protein